MYKHRHDMCCWTCGARGAVYGYSLRRTPGLASPGWYCLAHLSRTPEQRRASL